MKCGSSQKRYASQSFTQRRYQNVNNKTKKDIMIATLLKKHENHYIFENKFYLFHFYTCYGK